MSSGTLIKKKKDCVPDDEVFISGRQSQRDAWFRLDSFSSVIRALKGRYFLRFVVQDMLTLQALWVEEKRGRRMS